MKNKSIYLIKNLGSLSLVFLILSCSPKEEQPEARVIPVKVQQIAYETSASNQEYIGTIESENTVEISFLAMGTIERMYAHEGQKVSKGQLLASLNAATLKNTHDLSLAALKQAQDAHQRMKAMYDSNSIPEVQYIDVKTKLDQAAASEAIARKNLQDANVYAPQSGVIGKKHLEPGANVLPGTLVYSIMDISSVKVKVAIPEGEISNIRTGTYCEVKISALDNETFTGKIIEKGVSANPISHTYDIKIKIENPTGKIMPGMVCRAYLDNSGNSGTGNIVVPVKAVQVDHSGKRFVWLKDKNNKAVYKEVTLGKLFENGVQITSGLQEEDQLIIAGYQNVSEGSLVSVNK